MNISTQVRFYPALDNAPTQNTLLSRFMHAAVQYGLSKHKQGILTKKNFKIILAIPAVISNPGIATRKEQIGLHQSTMFARIFIVDCARMRFLSCAFSLGRGHQVFWYCGISQFFIPAFVFFFGRPEMYNLSGQGRIRPKTGNQSAEV